MMASQSCAASPTWTACFSHGLQRMLCPCLPQEVHVGLTKQFHDTTVLAADQAEAQDSTAEQRQQRCTQQQWS